MTAFLSAEGIVQVKKSMSDFNIDATLVVIPARSGSERIPNKNVAEIFWSTNDLLALDGDSKNFRSLKSS
jgi:hypothetical protein